MLFTNYEIDKERLCGVITTRITTLKINLERSYFNGPTMIHSNAKIEQMPTPRTLQPNHQK